MTTWNTLATEVSDMRTRLSNAWSRLGEYAGCPSVADSYKRQALVELARRLETERRLAEAVQSL